MWLRAHLATKGDTARQQLRDRERKLNEAQADYRDLENRAEREISGLRGQMSYRDQQILQLQTNLQASEASAERREKDLDSAARNLRKAADELGEEQWAGIADAIARVSGQGTELDDDRVTTAVSQQVNALRRQFLEQEGRAQELVFSLGRLGFDTSGVQGAVDKAPATALPSLVASLEAYVQQHTTESQSKEQLLLDIQRAETHCNRQITDAVGRRVPLQFLARAREMLENTTTEVEVSAAAAIVDQIVDDIYRLYLPRATR